MYLARPSGPQPPDRFLPWHLIVYCERRTQCTPFATPFDTNDHVVPANLNAERVGKHEWDNVFLVCWTPRSPCCALDLKDGKITLGAGWARSDITARRMLHMLPDDLTCT